MHSFNIEQWAATAPWQEARFRRICYQQLDHVRQAHAKLLPLYLVFKPVCACALMHTKWLLNLDTMKAVQVNQSCRMEDAAVTTRVEMKLLEQVSASVMDCSSGFHVLLVGLDFSLKGHNQCSDI